MVVTATSPPTRDFLSFVSEYIHDSVRRQGDASPFESSASVLFRASTASSNALLQRLQHGPVITPRLSAAAWRANPACGGTSSTAVRSVQVGIETPPSWASSPPELQLSPLVCPDS